MSIDVSALNLSYPISQILQDLLRKNPKRELVLKKLEAQMRSLRLLAQRDRKVDLGVAEKLYSQLIGMLRDTAEQSPDRQRLAVLACQYFYLKRDVVPDVGHNEGFDDDKVVADAVEAWLKDNSAQGRP